MKHIKFLRVEPTPTEDEIALCLALIRRGVEVRQQPFDGHKHIDIFLPAAKLDIEVDGIQHLTNPKQIVADLDRGHFSHRNGYDTMHIQNEMIRAHLDAIADGLAEAAQIREERMKKKEILIHVGSASKSLGAPVKQ